ncbi:MAG TPA: SOS response-associated peptidase [Opitutaceae bacterium]|nr:SOS response-associated peptidase [Opitutaceae bacterium]
MCTRFFLLRDHLKEIFERFGLEVPPEFASRYNIAPGSLLPAVRSVPRRAGYEAAPLRWGFLPSWSRPGQSIAPLVNARSETLAEKPAFRDAFRSRRCLIPASGYYEWEARGKARLPWAFRAAGGGPLCLAGLWEAWRTPDGTMLEGCAVVTTAPNGLMQPIHHRMPLSLGPEPAAAWLDPAAPPGKIAGLMAPPADSALSAVRVGTRVNRVGEEGPGCLEPPGADEGAGPQLDLVLG